MRKLALLLTGLFLIGIGMVNAQTKRVTGNVTSADDKQPIPGVTIQVKGTSLGTISDADGNYSLKVPDDAISLVFSFVGMETMEIAISGKSEINAQLKSSYIGMDEVVVTALGISKEKKAIGYATASVDGDDLTKTRSSSVMDGISGKMAGVQISSNSSDPGASSSVIIRGITSIGGTNQPLYIIDGVSMTNNSKSSGSLDGGYDFGNAANLINPDDVENVTVLKGAAATALYGSRASNGVVIITSKSGKGKAKVSFNSSVEYSDILKLPTFQNDFGMGWDAHHTLNENGSWGPRFDGSNRLWGTVYNNSQKLKPFVAQENNIKDFFEYGKKFNNSVSLSGGNDKTTYFSSLSLLTHDGLVPTDIDSYKKYTASFNGSHKMGKLTTSTSVKYSQQANNFAQTGQGLTIINALYQTPRDISIVGLQNYKTDPFNSVDYYYTPYGITNPYYLINELKTSFAQKKFIGKMQFDLEITKDLKAMYKFGIDASDNETKVGSPEVQASAGTPNAGSSTNQAGAVVKAMERRHEYNHDLHLTYNKKISDFELNALAGFNANERNFSSIAASVTGLDIPGFYNLSNSSNTPVINEYFWKRRIFGVFASVDIAYQNFLYATVTARNDYSSTLPSKNNSFFYPSATLAFAFSEILPSSIKDVITFGKARIAYGQAGNDADVYVLDPSFVQSNIYNPFRNLNFPLNGQNAFEVGNLLGNLALTPELSTEFEVGLEMSFFQNRFGFELSYYDKVSNHQIYPLGLAPSTGYTSQTTNLGEISNKGIEALINITPVKTSDFQWDMTINYSKNNNKLVSLPEELGEKIGIGGTSAIGFVAVVGQPIGLFELTVPQKTESGQIIVNPSSGRPVANNEKAIISKADHDYSIGIGNTLKYKNLAVSFDFDVRQGGLMYSRTADINYFVGNIPQTTYNNRNTFIIPNSVVDNGDGTYSENTTPISKEDMDDYWADGGSLLDESFLLPKSFVKLKRLSITYNLPQKWFHNLPIEGAALTAFGNNLLLWTPADNNLIDPEVTTFGNELAGKYGEFTANPSTRSLGVNLKLNF